MSLHEGGPRTRGREGQLAERKRLFMTSPLARGHVCAEGRSAVELRGDAAASLASSLCGPSTTTGPVGPGLTHSCQECTPPPLQARGRVPHGWRAVHGHSVSWSWLPASRKDLHTAPRTTKGRPRSPVAFLELDQAQKRPVSHVEEELVAEGTPGLCSSHETSSKLRSGEETLAFLSVVQSWLQVGATKLTSQGTTKMT